MISIARPSVWRRPEIMGALGVGTVALLLACARTMHEPGWPTDLDQWYYAARAMLAGTNPYEAVGPTRAFHWDWQLNYPLPAVLFTMPLTWLSLPMARVAFSAIGGGVLGFALGLDRFRRLGLVLSAAFLVAVSRNQWSLFITAAYFAPLAAVFLAAKPNLAVAFVAGTDSWRRLRWIVGVSVAVGIASLVVRPSWPLEWLGALKAMRYVHSPVIRPWGFLYALALLKWRRPDARIFLALVCVPQTPSLYDLLPLFAIPKSVREVSLLSLLTHVLLFAIVWAGPFDTFELYAYRLGYLSTFIVYLPVLAMLLRRPNTFSDPLSAAAEPRPPGLRARLLALSRLDVALLLVNLAASLLLVFLTLTTRRI